MLADKIKVKQRIRQLQTRWRRITLKHFEHEDNGKLPKAEKLLKKITKAIKALERSPHLR
jgi:hypothetical protein